LSKNKRLLTAKIEGKIHAETIDEEDASTWVAKQRKQQTLSKEKELADKMQKMLEEQDKEYSETNLQGLKVGHKEEDIQDGETLILTLKDAYVLDDKGNDLNDEEDILVNDRISAKEQTQKFLELKKGAKKTSNYVKSFDDDNKPLLPQYDEEAPKPSFIIGEDVDEKQRIEEIRKKLTLPGGKIAYSLDNAKTFASEFYTTEEMAKFKKPVKKKKVLRKKKTAVSDIINSAPSENDGDLGSRATSVMKEKELKAIEGEEKKLEAYEKAISKAVTKSKHYLEEKIEDEELPEEKLEEELYKSIITAKKLLHKEPDQE